jgi:intracellular multiplication protein IcmV
MPIKDVVKISRKTFFNPTGWLGYDLLKAQFKVTVNILKNAFSPALPQRKETFTEALKRLKLSEQDVQSIEKNYFLYAVIIAALGVITVIFSGYLLFSQGAFIGFLLGLLCATLFFVYAFRYHFWYFQIKHRKLGCTFAEWRQGKPFDHGEGES